MRPFPGDSDTGPIHELNGNSRNDDITSDGINTNHRKWFKFFPILSLPLVFFLLILVSKDLIAEVYFKPILFSDDPLQTTYAKYLQPAFGKSQVWTSSTRELLDMYWHHESTRTRALVKYQRSQQQASTAHASKEDGVMLAVWSQKTPIFHGNIHEGKYQCALPCEISFQRSKADDADALLLMMDRPEDELPGNKPFIGITWENLSNMQRSDTYRTWLHWNSNLNTQLNFALWRGLRPNKVCSYELDADIVSPYPFIKMFVEQYRPVPRAKLVKRAQNQTKAVFVLISNSKARIIPDRLGLLEEIAKTYPVDSYGKAMFNPHFHKKLEETVWEKKDAKYLQGQYLFSNAIENSYGVDYVTEKVFNALSAGGVPIYLGAPNIVDYLPDRNAVIHVGDFESPKQLAEYLHELTNDIDLYVDRHQIWRTRAELPEMMHEIASLLDKPLACSFCEAAAEIRRESRIGKDDVRSSLRH